MKLNLLILKSLKGKEMIDLHKNSVFFNLILFFNWYCLYKGLG